MENKTVAYLNSKIWYRLLKVIYILFFLLVLIGFNIFVFNEIGIKNVDQNRTLIQCNYKQFSLYYNKETFTPRSVGIEIGKGDFINQQFDYKHFEKNGYKTGKILETCYGDDYGGEGRLMMQEINENRSESGLSHILSFNIEPVFIYFHLRFIKYFFIGNLIILLAFELFKRCFYYVALGNVNPKK